MLRRAWMAVAANGRRMAESVSPLPGPVGPTVQENRERWTRHLALPRCWRCAAATRAGRPSGRRPRRSCECRCRRSHRSRRRPRSRHRRRPRRRGVPAVLALRSSQRISKAARVAAALAVRSNEVACLARRRLWAGGMLAGSRRPPRSPVRPPAPARPRRPTSGWSLLNVFGCALGSSPSSRCLRRVATDAGVSTGCPGCLGLVPAPCRLSPSGRTACGRIDAQGFLRITPSGAQG